MVCRTTARRASSRDVTLIGGGADGLINGIGDTTATTTTGVDGFYDFSA